MHFFNSHATSVPEPCSEKFVAVCCFRWTSVTGGIFKKVCCIFKIKKTEIEWGDILTCGDLLTLKTQTVFYIYSIFSFTQRQSAIKVISFFKVVIEESTVLAQ